MPGSVLVLLVSGARGWQGSKGAGGRLVSRGIGPLLYVPLEQMSQRCRFRDGRPGDSDPNVRATPNRLLSQPVLTAPNLAWVGDITYLPRQGGGWLYLVT